MFYEKPWRNEFDKLIPEIVKKYKASVSDPKNSDRDKSFREYEPHIFFYPNLKGVFKDTEFFFEISEYSNSRKQGFEEDDNIEFFHIFLYKKTEYNLSIRKEYILDKFKKYIGIEKDFQTGNDKFDKNYFLSAANIRDESLLRSLSFQQKVENLEPFSGLRLNEKLIEFSQEIKKKSQFDINEIDKILGKLYSLLD